MSGPLRAAAPLLLVGLACAKEPLLALILALAREIFAGSTARGALAGSRRSAASKLARPVAPAGRLITRAPSLLDSV